MFKVLGGKGYVLASFPRSGTNYFKIAWKQKTGRDLQVYRIAKDIQGLSHIENIEVISTIKEPISSLISRTMIYFHEYSYMPIPDTIEYSIQSYEDIYEWIISNSPHIIDTSKFSDLDNIIDTITGKDNKKLDHDLINQELDNKEKYSRTFVDHDRYQEISEMVLRHDLSRCKQLYEQAYGLSRYL